MTIKCVYLKKFDKLPHNERKEKIIDYCNRWILNNKKTITELKLENELSNNKLRQKYNCSCDDEDINDHKYGNTLLIEHFEVEIIDYTNALNEAILM